jgi:hypothetical protein
MRDDFTEDVKRALAARVANRCCNPECGAVTSGPQTDPGKAVNLGVAAHITAASAGGPRHDISLSPQQRQDIGNAIWLCQNCAKLVDNDPARYTVDLLRAWKLVAEDLARARVGKTAGAGGAAGVPLARLRIQLPERINAVGYIGGASFVPAWNVKVRLIADGDVQPLDIVELGLTEDGVGDWTIDEVFLQTKGELLGLPIRLNPSAEFWLRSRSPASFEAKPTSVGRLTLWFQDHTQGEGQRHEYVVDRLPMG